MNEAARIHPVPQLSAAGGYDVARLRGDFPILSQSVHGRPLVYLDNAASAQKPRAVIEAVRDSYETGYANVHRGVHALSERATRDYEGARETVRRFLNAARPEEIVFTKGATEAINLVAYSFGEGLGPGDEVVITELEHHSNIVPWQMLRERKGITLKVARVEDDGSVPVGNVTRLIGPRTRLVAVAHMSNVLGTLLPVAEIVRAAHAADAKVLLDGCQAITHVPVDVAALDCDFYVFSGHKLYGPSGIGVLYAKHALLEVMPPWQGGGDMIRSVTFEKTTYAAPPARFEAGTPPIVQAIGLGAALDYVSGIGMAAIAAHEADVLGYAMERLGEVPGLRLIGTAADKASVVSFVMQDAHPHDIATILDRMGIAVRAGHHCAQPLMERFGETATARASFALYNTREEVDALVAGLHKVREFFA